MSNKEKREINLPKIKKFIKNQEFNQFYRSPEIQKQYDLERERIIRKLKSELEQESRTKGRSKLFKR